RRLYEVLGPRGEGRARDLKQGGPLARLGPLVSWVLPRLPERPVRAGEVWETPAAALLRSLGQPGEGVEGHVYRVLDGFEERGGVRSARIRTLFWIRARQAQAEPSLGIGPGPALLRIEGEGTALVGLDGYLRRSRFEVSLSARSPETKRTTTAKLVRRVEAGPARAETSAPAKDWSRHMGDLLFVVGYEEGMAEARFTGRAPMFFYTRHGDANGARFGSTVFKDREVRERIEGYTPVLIDGDEDEGFPKKFEVFAEPAVIWADLEGKPLFMSQGYSPPEIFRQAAEVAERRAPEPRPSAGYEALLEVRNRLRAALKEGETKAAVAAVLEIRAFGRGLRIQEEAHLSDKTLTRLGEARLADAKRLLEAGEPAQARRTLEALVADYGEHPVGRTASERLAALPGC
ncbi:MAG: hypothetical protein ACE5JG_11630, partial [Planctomycetota bacterium]